MTSLKSWTIAGMILFGVLAFDAAATDASPDVEVSSEQLKVLQLVAKRYKTLRDHREMFYCTVGRQGDNVTVLVLPYSAEQLRQSVFGARRTPVARGAAVFYVVDPRSMKIVAEQPQR
jgi:hypothetical protein